MTRLRQQSIDTLHKRFGLAADAERWPADEGPLLEYLLMAAHEHWWACAERKHARKFMVKLGYLAMRIELSSRVKALELETHHYGPQSCRRNDQILTSLNRPLRPEPQRFSYTNQLMWT